MRIPQIKLTLTLLLIVTFHFLNGTDGVPLGIFPEYWKNPSTFKKYKSRLIEEK